MAYKISKQETYSVPSLQMPEMAEGGMMKNCAECFNMRGKMPEKIEDGIKVLNYLHHTVRCQKGYFKLLGIENKDKTFKHATFYKNFHRYYDSWELAETCVDYNIDVSFDWLRKANNARA